MLLYLEVCFWNLASDWKHAPSAFIGRWPLLFMRMASFCSLLVAKAVFLYRLLWKLVFCINWTVQIERSDANSLENFVPWLAIRFLRYVLAPLLLDLFAPISTQDVRLHVFFHLNLVLNSQNNGPNCPGAVIKRLICRICHPARNIVKWCIYTFPRHNSISVVPIHLNR